MTERVKPLKRQEYKLFRTLQTRWSDNDLYGHMNNVVHYQLFDSAVNGWLIEMQLLDLKGGKTVGLVVETACSYFSELAFPQKVDAGISVARIGNSSVEYRIGLFPEGGMETAAQGRFVHVYVDRNSRRPVSLPQDWRNALEALKNE